jgi:PAP2 superfamily protein
MTLVTTRVTAYATATGSTTTAPMASVPRTRVRPRAGLELAVLGVLYLCYSGARLLADDDPVRAFANAHRLLHLETILHLDPEVWANHLLAGVPALALVASYWYSALHYLVTPAVLVWVYRRHPLGYRRVRNALVGATAAGLIGFVLLPMAPPRMLPGYIDVLSSTSTHGWWGADASAPKGLGGLTNELAAMPSLHVGWALWCAWVVFLCSRRWWLRALAASYAAGTVLVVLGTANHYLLDAVAGAALIGAAVLVTRPRVTPEKPVSPETPARPPRVPSQRGSRSSGPRSSRRPVL